MDWTPLDSRRYGCKQITLPHLVFRDPAKFFWLLENNKFLGRHVQEALLIHRHIRNIRIPNVPFGEWKLEYCSHPQSGEFHRYVLVPSSEPDCDDGYNHIIKPLIDLGLPRELNPTDQKGTRALADLVVDLYWSRHAEVGAKRAHEFFETRENFVLEEREKKRRRRKKRGRREARKGKPASARHVIDGLLFRMRRRQLCRGHQ